MAEPSDNPSLVPQPGHLYVVATPIGNLADLSARARAILGSVDIVACEDTRTTGALLAKLGIRNKLVSYHEHNESEAANRLANQIADGRSVALASDAGTPAISDPGFRLVRACHQRGLPVVPVVGPSAIIAAISASGLPTNGFLFVGFLPPKSSARHRFFDKYRAFDYTLALYESCHRITKMLADIEIVLGADRVVCVAREVTKMHETFLSGRVAEVSQSMEGSKPRGEFVLLVAPSGFQL